MNIKEFRKQLMEGLKQRLGSNYEIEDLDITKINSTERMGITVRKNHIEVAPVIYIEDFYQSYKKGIKMGDIIDAFVSFIEDKSRVNQLQGHVRELKNWENIRKNIRMRIINTERNKAMLENLISKQFLNLSIIFYVEMKGFTGGMASVNVTKNLFQEYGIDMETLTEQALSNEERKSCIKSIINMMEELTEENMDQYSEDDMSMTILTNQDKVYGAAEIVSEKNRKALVEKLGNDCYVIPSSIHEMIVVPCDDKETLKAEELLNMVKEVNATCVAKDEYLADAVYMIHADDYRLELVAGE